MPAEDTLITLDAKHLGVKSKTANDLEPQFFKYRLDCHLSWQWRYQTQYQLSNNSPGIYRLDRYQ